jgi:predicted component of type VI protein secretion system
VTSRLDGADSLESWLMREGLASYNELFPDDWDEYQAAQDRRRATRIEWLNHILENL